MSEATDMYDDLWDEMDDSNLRSHEAQVRAENERTIAEIEERQMTTYSLKITNTRTGRTDAVNTSAGYFSSLSEAKEYAERITAGMSADTFVSIHDRRDGRDVFRVIGRPHTVRGKPIGPEGIPYGTTHDMDCPGCQGTSFTASPRSETYWSS